MENRHFWREKQFVPALVMALLLGVGLHDLFSFFPSIVTEFVAPVNESIWEHLKIVFFPLLLAELLFYPLEHRARGLLSLYIVCLGMLGVAWMYHVVLGGRAVWVDIVLFAVTILLWFWLSSVLDVPQSWNPLLRGILIVFIGLICAFTLHPPHGTLFNDPALADAWVVLTC